MYHTELHQTVAFADSSLNYENITHQTLRMTLMTRHGMVEKEISSLTIVLFVM